MIKINLETLLVVLHENNIISGKRRRWIIEKLTKTDNVTDDMFRHYLNESIKGKNKKC